MTGRCTAWCEKCVYRKVIAGAGPYCDYLCMTNERRPCPGGDGCTARVLLDARKPKAFTVQKERRRPKTPEEREAAELARKERKRDRDRERYQKRTEADREKQRERCRGYYERNKEKVNARHREWAKENREYLNAYAREFRRKKKEEGQA